MLSLVSRESVEQLFFAFSQKSWQQQRRVRRYITMVEKPVPWSPLFRSSTDFPADVIKCLCVCVCVIMLMLVYALSFWNKLVLLVGGRGHDGLFFEMAIVWFMGQTFKPMSHHLWLNSGTLSSHCWRSWYRLTWFFYSSASTAWIWQQSDTCSCSLSECSRLTQMKFPTCYQLHG